MKFSQVSLDFISFSPRFSWISRLFFIFLLSLDRTFSKLSIFIHICPTWEGISNVSKILNFLYYCLINTVFYQNCAQSLAYSISALWFLDETYVLTLICQTLLLRTFASILLQNDIDNYFLIIISVNAAIIPNYPHKSDWTPVVPVIHPGLEVLNGFRYVFSS